MTTASYSFVQLAAAVVLTAVIVAPIFYTLGVWPHDAYRERDAARAETEQARKATAIARTVHIARVEKCGDCPTCTPEPIHLDQEGET